MDPQTRATEIRAASAVRRLIQKVRLATPETLEVLENDVFESLAEQMEFLGSLHAQVQEEVERGLELAQRRVDQIREKREKEEEQAQRPKQLIEEVKELMETLQARISTLKEAACLEAAGGVVLQLEDAEAVLQTADECAMEIKAFSQACVAKATEIKEHPLPPEMTKQWRDLAPVIVEVKRQAELTVVAAKAATRKVGEAQRKQRLEELKASLKERMQDALAAVPMAEGFVVTAEKLVEPFIHGKPRAEEDMDSLAEQADEALAEAQGAITAAKTELRPLAEEGLEVDLEDELLKKELKAFVTDQEKLPRIRLGQFDRRLVRVHNIVERYRTEKNCVKNKVMFESLKAELLQKVMRSAHSVSVEVAEPAIKEAEKAVEPCGKHKGMRATEMAELAAKADRAMTAAKAALAQVHQEVCPIAEGVDEEVKAKLHALIAPHLKRPAQVKLGQFDRRLARVANLLSQFRSELQKRKHSEHGRVQQHVMKAVRHHLAEHEMTTDALFEQISALSADASVIDQAAFFSFVETAQGAEDALELPQEELTALFLSHVSEGQEALGKEEFLRLVGALLVVAKSTTLTTEQGLTSGKLLRPLKVGEELQMLESPITGGKAGLTRAKVRALRDDQEGWATVVGNAGTILLAEASGNKPN